tara:strand:+ start:168 stop:476 length:309 start_codon:yes stop_codon:yes gene_type:complete
VKTKHQLTAVIYDRKGNVLSIGQNSYIKSHPLQAEHAKLTGNEDKIFLHAEIHAIVKLKTLQNAHRIFVSRWDKHGKPKLAKPCPICCSAIAAAGIEVIEHT